MSDVLRGHGTEKVGDSRKQAACLYVDDCFFTPHYCTLTRHPDLHMLHTDPDYQGRGAGSLLIDSIVKRADALGLPIYLESSAAGHRFYQNRGFKDIDVLEVDFTRWDGPLHKQPLMLREPSQ